MPPAEQSSGRVALVLAGGGARGAYEIGALSALLPALDADERPQIVVGTSVGAINAAYLAAHADCSPEGVAEGGMQLWKEIDYDSVLKPLCSLSEGRRLLSYLGEVLGSGCARTASVLDPKPLVSTLDRVAVERIHANVGKHLATAAVVATSGRTNMSVVFHDGGESPPVDAHRGISYVSTKLTKDHVRASAAIPLLFPAVPIEEGGQRRWYFDGGTRLNAPIKPALALGAERIIVIALNSLTPMHAGEADVRPDALDGAGQLIQAVLVDPLVNDVHTLAMVNELLADGAGQQAGGAGQQAGGAGQQAGGAGQQAGGAGQQAQAGERRSRRRVPYMLIAPQDPMEIGNIATEIYGRHFSSPLSFVRSPNLSSLGHLVSAGRSAVHGELLSYLLFAKEFIERLIELGRGDAERWLREAHDDGRWQLERL